MVIVGVGKSGNIGHKIAAATLNSTGARSGFKFAERFAR